jgi:transposase
MKPWNQITCYAALDWASDHHDLVAVPWAEKYGRFTRLFERFAIDVLQACSITEAAQLLRISWDEADGIKARAVKRGLERKPAKVNKDSCVDGKSVARGHHYVTAVAVWTCAGTCIRARAARKNSGGQPGG